MFVIQYKVVLRFEPNIFKKHIFVKSVLGFHMLVQYLRKNNADIGLSKQKTFKDISGTSIKRDVLQPLEHNVVLIMSHWDKHGVL